MQEVVVIQYPYLAEMATLKTWRTLGK